MELMSRLNIRWRERSTIKIYQLELNYKVGAYSPPDLTASVRKNENKDDKNHLPSAISKVPKRSVVCASLLVHWLPRGPLAPCLNYKSSSFPSQDAKIYFLLLEQMATNISVFT